MYETINSPINYGGLELKNRIIFAPTTFGLAEEEYFEKIRKIDPLRRRAILEEIEREEKEADHA